MNKIIAVAIDSYEDESIGDLKNCRKDITDLIDVLSSRYQFDEIDLYTKSEQTTLPFLHSKLYDELVNSLESDNLLILYAGHGEFNERLGASYWLCSDSQKSKVTTWLNVRDLLDFFNCSNAKHIALISDSCFSGAIFETRRGGGLSAIEGKKSRQALTSGGIEMVSDGKENENSPFATALIKVLNDNNKEALPFSELSITAITEFSKKNSQTPSFGSLHHCGDEQGSFFFKLKHNNMDMVQPMQLPLEINSDVKIDHNFKIPFFNSNKYFNSSYINAFVQNLGYEIVNEIRMFVTGDEPYSISRSADFQFWLSVSYNIETFNERYLSIEINRDENFGGIHPNYYVYTINFAFKPDRKLTLYDILDCQNLEQFLLSKIDKYAEEECKEYLREYSTYEYTSDLDFSFNDSTFKIYYMNLMPHVIKACGILEIPRNEVKFKI